MIGLIMSFGIGNEVSLVMRSRNRPSNVLGFTQSVKDSFKNTYPFDPMFVWFNDVINVSASTPILTSTNSLAGQMVLRWIAL